MTWSALICCLTLCSPKDYILPGSSAPGFLQQQYWSGFPFPTPGDLPNPDIKLVFLVSPAWQADSLPPALLIRAN